MSLTKAELIAATKLEKARRNFWYYSKLTAPDFYRDDRAFLREICDGMQDFYASDDEFLVINAPPRHGKSRTGTQFVQWVLGRYPTDKVITGSYNETLSTTFSKGVRNKIQEKAADGRLVYHDIFPNTRVRYGDAAANLWGLEGTGTNSYLATSPSGTVTGFGGDLILIDDIIKSEYEARNENIKDAHWRWFTDTMMSRREGKRKVIIVMTRWATDDLAGRLIEDCKRRGKTCRVLTYKAWDGTRMLCDDILSKPQYDGILNSDTSTDIVRANYDQEPVDIVGRLYTAIKEYEKLPDDRQSTEAYFDTADQGEDYLCGLIYDVKDADAFTRYVMYTQAAMEHTEDEAARIITELGVNICRIESNNGGRGWGRNVARIAREKYGNTITQFQFFTQTKNKQSRILTNSTGVMNRVYMPQGWTHIFPEYARDMLRYQRIGANAHDDAPDATTGVYEYLPRKRAQQDQTAESAGAIPW